MSEAPSGAFVSRVLHVACAYAGCVMQTASPCCPQSSLRVKQRFDGSAASHSRKGEYAHLLRQINPAGESPKSLSSPSRKNIALALSGKSVI
jgi:hypothetical protein